MQTRTIQLLYVLLLLFLSSCATGPRPNTANYEKILNLWVGEQIEQLTTTANTGKVGIGVINKYINSLSPLKKP